MACVLKIDKRKYQWGNKNESKTMNAPPNLCFVIVFPIDDTVRVTPSDLTHN